VLEPSAPERRQCPDQVKGERPSVGNHVLLILVDGESAPGHTSEDALGWVWSVINIIDAEPRCHLGEHR
jgi:hypothetical protein